MWTGREPHFLGSPLTFRHVREQGDLPLCFSTGRGGLPKINTSRLLHSQPHSFHLWPMTTARCGLLLSAVHNVEWASHNFYCVLSFGHSVLSFFGSFVLPLLLWFIIPRCLFPFLHLTSIIFTLSITALRPCSSFTLAFALEWRAPHQCRVSTVAAVIVF